MLLAAVLAVAGAAPAGAHPLGNVSVNHYAGLIVGQSQIRIDYVLDLAELPTVRERQAIDTDGDDEIGEDERAAYETRRCGELADGVTLQVGEISAPVSAGEGDLRFADGEAGLEVLRLECELTTEVGVDADDTEITFIDANSTARVGWREVTAVGDEVTLAASDVPERSVSDRLAEYPDDVDRLDVTAATIVASPGGAPSPVIGDTPFGDQARAATDRFTSLIASDDVTIPLVVTSLLVASLFGALHSLAPGHGKSVIAAYLLGQQRDRRLALLLGLTVALTHTASVLVFGGILSVTESAAPEQFYPLFGLVSGLLFVGLGVALLRQVRSRHRAARASVPTPAPAPVGAMAGTGTAGDHGHTHAGHVHGGHMHDGHVHAHPHTDHDHHHDHDHDHDHGWHEHEHVDLGAVASGEIGWRGVILPGLAGGLVPSPSALLVFLGGLALGRAWFGVALVFGYGVGIALTLVTAGYLLARAGDGVRGRRIEDRFPRLARIAVYLPAATAVLVILGGLRLAVLAVL